MAHNKVAVADLPGVSQIHKIGSGFLKSGFYANLTPYQNPGIFATRGPHAHSARSKQFARILSDSSLRNNEDAEVRRKVTLAVPRVSRNAAGASKRADVLKWWTLTTTDVIAHLYFGEIFYALEFGKVDFVPATLIGPFGFTVQMVNVVHRCASKHST